ncbi:MAG: GNAT family N-acetyltransferase [Oscillospiraceae bacterium]|nr:GNAT family N-acetyltransferase [Oscillospiraceae bacterium]
MEYEIEQLESIDDKTIRAFYQRTQNGNIPKLSHAYQFYLMEEDEYAKDLGKHRYDTIFAAIYSNDIVGLAWARADFGFSSDPEERSIKTPEIKIAVCTEYQGRGIGTSLMNDLTYTLAKNGFYEAEAYVSNNSPALRFFWKLSFNIYEDKGQEYRMLKPIDTFRKENVDKIFSVFNSKKEYIANIHDLYSEPGEKDKFDDDWAKHHPPGKYVICVYQRHSVYDKGSCIYRNNVYDEPTGDNSKREHPDFVIVLDKAQEYTVPCGGGKLISHIIMNENNTLQSKVYSEKEAQETAAMLSQQGYKAAVMERTATYLMDG